LDIADAPAARRVLGSNRHGKTGEASMSGLCRARRVLAVVALGIGVCLPAVNPASSTSAISVRNDGSLEIAGRKVACGSVRSALDPRLGNLGISVPDRRLLVINPVRLARETETVRLFVFYHECGHHHVGGSELQADCWAVGRGVREGWLDRSGLGQVCKSFGNAPETRTHPAAVRRCGNLDRCFLEANARPENDPLRGDKLRARHTAPVPQLVSGPTLIRRGISRQ
jgi:hypothetical protein